MTPMKACWHALLLGGAAAASQIHAAPAVPAGMSLIPAGEFEMGSTVERAWAEEQPAHRVRLSRAYLMDQTEVTNAQFAQFVAATGYRTLAERGLRQGDAPDAPVIAGSAVFRPRGGPEAMRSFVNWWQFEAGASWQHPDGPGTSINGLEQHPVVHIAFEDALAYAQWKGHSLPTEAQFEFAAQGGARKNAAGEFAANSWQGMFPSLNTAADGYSGTAPVGCFDANPFGLHDLIGNVWEWTQSPYYERHDFAAKRAHPQGFDPVQPDEKAVAVLKGGSFLCAPDYCMRYRPEARIGQSLGLGASHIGFRTVLNP
jgi:formylglycine-generating enzyme